MDFEQAIRFLEGLGYSRIKIGLERVRDLARIVGNPERSVRVVHIAGTNGKGSTAAAIAAILKTAGYRVGRFTSPHLLRFQERICIDGVEIAEEALGRILTKICRALAEEGEPHAVAALAGTPPPTVATLRTPTYFEVATMAAFLYFAEEGCDCAVVETGLGGRLDATNIVDPLLCAITTIAFDHMDYLGNTLRQIAREKGGIVKPGVPVIAGVRAAEALEAIVEICEARGAELEVIDRDFRMVGEDTTNFGFRGKERDLDHLSVPLQGRHQLDNMAVALAAIERLERLGFSIPSAAIREGLATLRWPGRCQRFATRPPLLLDGAHNPAGIEALRSHLLEGERFRHLWLVAAFTKGKAIETMLPRIAEIAHRVILTTTRVEKAAPIEMLRERIAPKNGKWIFEEESGRALDRAFQMAGPEDLICVTGSLYLVGELLPVAEERAWQDSNLRPADSKSDALSS